MILHCVNLNLGHDEADGDNLQCGSNDLDMTLINTSVGIMDLLCVMCGLMTLGVIKVMRYYAPAVVLWKVFFEVS